MKKNKTLVIAINGIATSGKDELVTKISNKFSNDGMKIDNISSVDYIKELALMYFDWDGVKDEKGRNLLSDLKDASTKYNNKPFNDYVEKILERKADVYFVHIREIDEIQELKEWCALKSDIDCVTLKVERHTVTNAFTNNTGDIGATLTYDYDHTLYNSKTISDWSIKSQEWFKSISTPIFGKLKYNAE